MNNNVSYNPYFNIFIYYIYLFNDALHILVSGYTGIRHAVYAV